MLQAIVTGSEGFLENKTEEEQKQYFENALKLLDKKFGKENVFSAIVHMDEKTPHMHVNMVPVTQKDITKIERKQISEGEFIEIELFTPKGTLSCKDVFTPAECRILQDDAYKTLFEPYGLERGEVGEVDERGYSIRKHKTVQQMKREDVEKREKKIEEFRHYLIDGMKLEGDELNADVIKCLEILDERIDECMSDTEKQCEEKLKNAEKEAEQVKKDTDEALNNRETALNKREEALNNREKNIQTNSVNIITEAQKKANEIKKNAEKEAEEIKEKATEALNEREKTLDEKEKAFDSKVIEIKAKIKTEREENQNNKALNEEHAFRLMNVDKQIEEFAKLIEPATVERMKKAKDPKTGETMYELFKMDAKKELNRRVTKGVPEQHQIKYMDYIKNGAPNHSEENESQLGDG
jgi:hypothetical protein